MPQVRGGDVLGFGPAVAAAGAGLPHAARRVEHYGDPAERTVQADELAVVLGLSEQLRLAAALGFGELAGKLHILRSQGFQRLGRSFELREIVLGLLVAGGQPGF